MANFVAVIDPNSERRSHFIKSITPLLPPLDGLVTYTCGTANFAIVWAANPTAPMSHETMSGGATVVLGEAIVPTSTNRMTATAVQEQWRDNHYTTFPPFDGFYMAIAYHPEHGLAVGADILGLFPVYYYHRGDVLLVASSPELFQYHPCFHKQFNPAGLVGILLSNGLVDGQTLWSDVRRLDVGCLLIHQIGAAPKEVSQYSIPQTLPYEKYRRLSHAEQIDAIDHALNQAIARHTSPTETHILMLSGGLDSRTLAGFLHRQQIDTVALTLGKRSDLEMQCATAVTRALKLPHYTDEVDLRRYPTLASERVKWEHLANGFSLIFNSSRDSMRQLGSRVVTGFVLDVIMGKSHRYRLFSDGGSFDAFFRDEVNFSGLSPVLLNSLLRREIFSDIVQDTVERMRDRYHHYGDLDSRRAMQFKLSHRQRFHVGSGAWRLSFTAWPILPVLDQQFVETMMTIPGETLNGRKAQQQLLCDRFPQLAQLPLDRNSHNIAPLQPTPLRQQLTPLYTMQRRWWGLQRRLGYDRRYYYRVLDINNTGWRAIRQAAEPHRDKVRHLFHDDVFDRLLPKPNTPLRFQKDAIVESASTQTLLGLLLWSAEHLQ